MPALGRCHARQDGFDLHQASLSLRVSASASNGSADTCCVLPSAQDRLSLTAEGQIRLELKHPWSDGTTPL